MARRQRSNSQITLAASNARAKIARLARISSFARSTSEDAEVGVIPEPETPDAEASMRIVGGDEFEDEDLELLAEQAMREERLQQSQGREEPWRGKGKGKGRAKADEPSSSTLQQRDNDPCPIVDKETRPFRLMDLPTEIRLEIYRACLTRPYNILLAKKERPPIAPPMPIINFEGEDDADPATLTASWWENSAPAPAPAPAQGPAVQTEPTQPSAAPAWNDFTLSDLNSQQGNPYLLLPRSMWPRTVLPAPSANGGNGAVSTRLRPRRRPSRVAATVRNAAYTAQPCAHHNATSTSASSQSTRNPDPLLVNLLRANSTILKEANSVLYSENVFTVELTSAIETLKPMHQRTRRLIKHVELEIPTFGEILERFQETVRTSLRYCSGLKVFVVKMPFVLPGSDGSGTTGNTTVYANGFDILRWLPQDCDVVMEGNVCSEIATVVNKHLYLAKTLNKLAYARRQLIAHDAASPLGGGQEDLV